MTDVLRRDEAFRVAVTPLIEVAVGVLRRLGVRNPLELDDAVQRVLELVDRKFDELQSPSELRAYLCAVCVNAARDVGRQRKREGARGISSEDDVDAMPSSSPTPEDALEHKEELALLQRLLEAMDEERREVFVLYELEELTGQEIAKHLGIPMGTVASRLRTAREEFVSMAARMHARGQRGIGRR